MFFLNTLSLFTLLASPHISHTLLLTIFEQFHKLKANLQSIVEAHKALTIITLGNAQHGNDFRGSRVARIRDSNHTLPSRKVITCETKGWSRTSYKECITTTINVLLRFLSLSNITSGSFIYEQSSKIKKKKSCIEVTHVASRI